MKKLIFKTSIFYAVWFFCAVSAQAQFKKNEIVKSFYHIDDFWDAFGVVPHRTTHLIYDVSWSYFRHFKNGFSVKMGVAPKIGVNLYYKYPDRKFERKELIGRSYDLWHLGVEKSIFPYDKLQLLVIGTVAKRHGYESYEMDPQGFCLLEDLAPLDAWGYSVGGKLRVYALQQVSLNAEVSYYQFLHTLSRHQLLANFSVGYRFNAAKRPKK